MLLLLFDAIVCFCYHLLVVLLFVGIVIIFALIQVVLSLLLLWLWRFSCFAVAIKLQYLDKTSLNKLQVLLLSNAAACYLKVAPYLLSAVTEWALVALLCPSHH